MSRIGCVFASYRALLDGLLNFTNAILLIRHDCLLSFLRELPAPKCIRPRFRKNDTDAPMLYFKEFWIPRRAESYVKTRTTDLQKIPFNCLIASAQRRPEPLRAILFFPLLPNILEPARAAQFTRFHFRKKLCGTRDRLWVHSLDLMKDQMIGFG